MIPQVVLSFLSMAGGAWATIRGAYLDGTKVPAAHIFADQLIYIGIGVAVIYAVFKPFISLANLKIND